MASGTIKNFSNDSGTNYCKMPDGTMICWGGDSIPANKGKVTITFPFSFVDTTYQIVFSAVFMATSDVPLTGGVKTASTCEIYRNNTTASEQPVNWIAIGRWK